MKAGDKADLQADVKDMQAEAGKGAQADESFLARQLRNIKRTAPDILDVALKTLANPLLGLQAITEKLAERFKTDEKDKPA